ncbi:MAG: hypothetical protein IT555_14600 [Acetobacteraceae bacterium]|nr:hypothetical protein [Acetobacteraceae bacterium]
MSGKVTAGAEVQIWQANCHGRYRYDGDVNPAPARRRNPGGCASISRWQPAGARCGYRIRQARIKEGLLFLKKKKQKDFIHDSWCGISVPKAPRA